MITKAYIYKKTIKKVGYIEEYILLIGDGYEVIDLYSIDARRFKVHRHHKKAISAVVRGTLPLLLGAYKQVDLGQLNEYLTDITLDALQKQSVSV